MPLKAFFISKKWFLKKKQKKIKKKSTYFTKTIAGTIKDCIFVKN